MEIHRIVLFFLVGGFVFWSCDQKTNPFSFQAIEVDSGWGYEVFHKQKVIIRQQIIPGIPGNTSFRTQEEAEKVAKIVVGKLARNQNPMVSKQELNDLGIDYKGSRGGSEK